MPKQKLFELSTQAQDKVVSMFRGSKGKKPVIDARVIAGQLKIPYRQVMLCLEKKGLRKYSHGSY